MKNTIVPYTELNVPNHNFVVVCAYVQKTTDETACRKSLFQFPEIMKCENRQKTEVYVLQFPNFSYNNKIK